MLLTTEQTLTIPLIDISPFLAPDDAPDVTIARHATAELVDKACRDVGFFYVIGHGISEEECAGIRTVAKDFFELPENGNPIVHHVVKYQSSDIHKQQKKKKSPFPSPISHAVTNALAKT